LNDNVGQSDPVLETNQTFNRTVLIGLRPWIGDWDEPVIGFYYNLFLTIV